MGIISVACSQKVCAAFFLLLIEEQKKQGYLAFNSIWPLCFFLS